MRVFGGYEFSAANLDRIQVIKGRVDASGTTQQKVYDVAWSGGRKPGKDGKLPLVGNAVNVKEATCANAIGAPALQTFGKDPNFDSRSELYATALAEFLSRRRSKQVTARLDAIYEEVDSTLDDEIIGIQSRSLPHEK